MLYNENRVDHLDHKDLSPVGFVEPYTSILYVWNLAIAFRSHAEMCYAEA